MFIHNVRYGFATNSSSTHSIVLINKGVRVNDSDCEDQEFGWGFFTCASEEAKRQYLGQAVKINLTHLTDLEDEDAAIIASKWAGVEVNPSGYIDHQSIIAIPSDVHWGRYHLRRDFFSDLLAFILREDVAILGGSDNDEEKHPLIYDGAKNVLKRHQWDDEEIGSPVLNLMLESGSKHLRARYDKAGKFWSLFCGRSGTKVRTSFTEEANADKSEVPELVDIKITDYCKIGCRFCYQGSTPQGRHAHKDLIRQVACALKELETFEVALGGGEPTEHPDLLEIIDYFNNMGIVVNLTTRNEDWVIDNLPKIKDKIGGIGLSVDSNQGLLDKLSKLRTHLPNYNSDYGLKLTVQVIVGSCSQREMQYIFETCKTFHLTVLLLGWKYTHRGAKGSKEDVNLIELLDSFRGKPVDSRGEMYTPWEGPSVSFDTSIVNQMNDWLEVHGDKWTFTTREGAHSMYIDCVSEMMHRSSYETSGDVLDSGDREMSVHIQNYFSTL